MKKLLSVFTAAILFAACAGKDKRVFMNKATDCVCSFYTELADIYNQHQAAAEKDQAAFIQKMVEFAENQPECVSALEVEEAKITATMSEAQKEDFKQSLDKMMKKKCPKSVETVNNMSK